MAQQQQQHQVDDGHSHLFVSKRETFLVAAIDIGTTDSGYAFSFISDPATVHITPRHTGTLLSMKEPTCVLFDENKKFLAFGYAAQYMYSELALDGDHLKMYFFNRFKMRLHEKKIKRDIELKDDKGQPMKAMVVFGEIIKFLKNDLFDHLEKRGTGVENKDVHWVLTVPAIWSDSAKQFMRESAYLADIDRGQLSIALEPEAASLYCQLISTTKGYEGAKFDLTSPGTKYMVIDLGGGAADITVHERLSSGGVKELYKASGGSWGGTKVDEEFYKLLIAIVGAPTFLHYWEHESPYLCKKLETIKRTITPLTKRVITLNGTMSLRDMFESENEMGETFEDAINNSPYKGKIRLVGDQMRIEADVFKALFIPCIDQIVSHVKGLLSKPEVTGTSIILMVGGFSECAMVQDAVMKALPKCKVIIPKEAGLAVLKGAVIFGHRPSSITSRVAKYTYGISISPPFDKSVHPEDHKVVVGNVERCRDVFKKYIDVGETVRVGEGKSGKHVTLKPNQREMLLTIFASPRNDPMFVDEEDTEYLGKLVVKLPEIGEKITVEVKMMFGETELTVKAHELHSHTKYWAYFDFL